MEHYLQYQSKEFVQYVKEFDLQFSDFIDEELILLIDMLNDSRDVYSQRWSNPSKASRKVETECGIEKTET